MRPRRILLAVDLSYQTYRAASSHQDLTNADGVFTGGLYGFLVMVAKIINDSGATHVVVTEDRKPYHRSKLYPEYKLIRKSTMDEKLKAKVEVSKPQIMETLAVIGIPVVGVPGYESDDVIAHYAGRHRHRFDLIYAASNDSDLFQLLEYDTFRVYRKDEHDIIDRQRLLEDTGLSPSEFSLATALMGTHNDVEGIPKVGIKTACAAVKNASTLRMYRERHGAMIDRNKRLIALPYEGFPRDLELPGPTRRFDARTLYRFMVKYDITVTNPMLNAFERICP
jgi:DNA polymerase-1